MFKFHSMFNSFNLAIFKIVHFHDFFSTYMASVG